MSIAIETQPAAATQQPLARRRWTTEEFYRLMDDGYVREGSSTYLWDGEIIDPRPEKPPHVDVEECLLDLLLDPFPKDAWTIRSDKPLRLRDGYEPQPDVMVLKGPRSSHFGRFPTPADVELLAEISSTTYAFDSGDKLAEYARAAIPAYWIVHLDARMIWVCSNPDVERGLFRDCTPFRPGASIPLADRAIAVADVFLPLSG